MEESSNEMETIALGHLRNKYGKSEGAGSDVDNDVKRLFTPNRIQMKIILFERRMGQDMKQSAKQGPTIGHYKDDQGPADPSQVEEKEWENYGLLKLDIAKPCTESSTKQCGMIGGHDIAGEEDAWYYYGRGSGRDVARHYFRVAKGGVEAGVEDMLKTYPAYPHGGESNNAESFGIFDYYLIQKRLGQGTHENNYTPSRYGHGITFIKFPRMLDILKGPTQEPNTACIEINPISNQVLGYIPDLRNHPGYNYLRQGVAIAISFDDPSSFTYPQISYDWYQIILAWQLNLADMKEIALNSILCSAAKKDEQTRIFKLWTQRYTYFLMRYAKLAIRTIRSFPPSIMEANPVDEMFKRRELLSAARQLIRNCESYYDDCKRGEDVEPDKEDAKEMAEGDGEKPALDGQHEARDDAEEDGNKELPQVNEVPEHHLRREVLRNMRRSNKRVW
eukprot:GFYU01009801.1.p1 GENE.GFYU01009801.1~~GFYU01009801.1.p1  ORF type:complete len:494 (+),score=147.47 GFYU01009801.1:139-1482(+)